MNDYNNKKEEKGGFLSALSGLFRGGSSAVGGASSGMGSAAGGMGGLFASKAGILGMVLGGATIAAGVGVVYNFVGPSSKPVYNPDLFQNTYYEEEASKASQERALSRDASSASASTLDMFREQAKKDGLSGLAGEGGEGGAPSSEAPAAADSAADASAEAPEAGGAAGAAGAAPGGHKLQAQSGFGGKAGGGGGSGTSIPRMQGAGAGLSGGIGAQFKPMYRAPAQADGGKTSAMSASAARIKNSPKYAVPNTNKKGAYGQAKFAGKLGSKAAFSADSAGARTGATEAFSGETSGAGDVASPESGAGLSGAGVSNGPSLKGNDPSLSSNESTPPKVPDPEDVDPWQKYEDMAMKGMMIALGLIIVTKILGKIAKSWPPLYYAALLTGAAAIGAALMVVYAGYKMYSEFGQKMMGGIYMLTGVMLAIQAWNAICGLDTSTTGADGVVNNGTSPTWMNGMSGMSINLGGI